MTIQSVQGSITITRMRTGGAVTLELGTSGSALRQLIDTTTGTVYPDWSNDDNDAIRPIITPILSCSTDTVYLDGGSWAYNGQTLVFGTESNEQGYLVEQENERFWLDPETYALKIVKNLASKENYASDTLEFTCYCTAAGVEYTMTRSIEIVILEASESSYSAALWTEHTYLTETIKETVINASLTRGLEDVEQYHIKWYRNFVSDDNLFTTTDVTDTTGSITVTRDDVNGGDNNNDETGGGGTLFIAYFYSSSTSTTKLAQAKITIADEADIYSLNLRATSSNKYLMADDPTSSVTVTASLVDSKGAVTGANPTYTFSVLDRNLEVAKTEVYSDGDTASITVTNDDADDQSAVNIVCDAQFTI